MTKTMVYPIYTPEQRKETLQAALKENMKTAFFGGHECAFTAEMYTHKGSIRVVGNWFNMEIEVVTWIDLGAVSSESRMKWALVDPELEGDEYDASATFKMNSFIRYIGKQVEKV